jgi:hypothetical protein
MPDSYYFLYPKISNFVSYNTQRHHANYKKYNHEIYLYVDPKSGQFYAQ